jgi:hypothetical protein
MGPSRSWSYGSWVYNYLCNQCLSPLKLWVRTPFMARCTRLCDKVCQCLATDRCFSPVSFTNKTDRHDITEKMLKVALNTINPPTLFTYWHITRNCIFVFFSLLSPLEHIISKIQYYTQSANLGGVRFASSNRNYSAILATLQITSYALGV